MLWNHNISNAHIITFAFLFLLNFYSGGKFIIAHISFILAETVFEDLVREDGTHASISYCEEPFLTYQSHVFFKGIII